MKSILQEEKRCYFCGTTQNLHLHHIYHGRANRKKSDKHGFTVYLCGYHHNLGGNGKCVHKSREMDLILKRDCQAKYEETHSREEFMAIIGKNYLD